MDSAAVRDIGEIPLVRDQSRRDQGGDDIKFFCEAYFPERFYLGFCGDHLLLTHMKLAGSKTGLLMDLNVSKSQKTASKDTFSETFVLFMSFVVFSED